MPLFLMVELMIQVVVALFVYSAIHSVLASSKAKQGIRTRVGLRLYNGFYRLAYNTFATLSFLPVLVLIVVVDSETVWRLDPSWNIPLWIIRFFGLIGFCVALLQTDVGRFAGLSQMISYFSGRPLPAEELKTTGLYRYSRHPLYVFSVLILWPASTMTDTYLAFCIGTTIYFLIGSRFEEHRMLKAFGKSYSDYRARVPWLFALSWRRKRN